MGVAHLTTLTASGESETLEFKETTGTRREATMTVCARLNQGGGQVLFKPPLHKLMTEKVRVGELELGRLS